MINLVNDLDIITFLISHNIMHLKYRHTCFNISGIFSKADLIKQYNKMLKQVLTYLNNCYLFTVNYL